MVDFPDLSSLSNSSGIGELLSLPNASYPFYWAWIMGGIWFIIVLTSYFREQEKKGTGNILSSMAVASLAIMILSLLGTVAGFISNEVMIPILVLGLVIVGIWIFASRRT